MGDKKVARVLDLLAQEAIHRASVARAADLVRGVYDYQRDQWVSDLNTAMTDLLTTPEAPDAN